MKGWFQDKRNRPHFKVLNLHDTWIKENQVEKSGNGRIVVNYLNRTARSLLITIRAF